MLEKDAMEQHQLEVQERVKNGEAWVVLWDDIKDKAPKNLKVHLLSMVPHKSRKYRAILDLSFELWMAMTLLSVNQTTTKTAPKGSINQLGNSLQRITHAFTEADDEKEIFLAKQDIKDSFWRLMCALDQEWNFCYVVPQEEGEPTRIVLPTSLQMGWMESPGYFGGAQKRDEM